jgi:hypothetical protein
MGAMPSRLAAALALLALLLIALGCAAPPRAAEHESPAGSPRVRCVSDPREQGTRPLFYFFCIESP